MSDYRLTGLALLGVLAGVVTPASGIAQAPQDSCVTCHAAFTSDTRLSGPVDAYAEDIHAARDLGCAACHGGDASDPGMGAMDPAKGFVGKPARAEVPRFCGRCHSSAEFMKRYNPSIRVDQVSEYRTSVHGHLLLERGDTRVATCISCHPPHSIKPPSDPTSSVYPLNVSSTCAACHGDAQYMEQYNIPTDQPEKYSRSIHWEKLSVEADLSAPTCNDCHGNHGAAPPGVSWVGNVCGQCHTVIAGLFEQSFHSGILAMLGQPGCATCHGNHEIKETNDELLGLGEGAACAMCHSESDGGGTVAAEMRSLIDSLRAQSEAADSILDRAENSGMEVSDALFQLNDARTALIGARNAVHSFSVDSVASRVESGLDVTSQAYARGERALRDLQIRRLGLAISVTIILILIVGLVLKIRQVENRPGIERGR